MSKLNKVFVYGTLKEHGGLSQTFDGARISSERATLKGTMISLGYFPGVVLQSNRTIIGELHEYEDFDNVLFFMDLVEGCSGKKGEADDLYHREVVEVDTIYGKESAWIYTFNTDTPLEQLDIVESGEWKI